MMAKNRLIFTLLVDNGTYMLSRNFSLQAVGDLNWIKENYNFDAIAFSIDELIVLNVSREDKNSADFSKNLITLSKNCFMPIAAGGGICSIKDAYALLDAGADKIVVNSALIKNPELVTSLVTTFGSQFVVASIDYKEVDGTNEVFILNGTHRTNVTVPHAVKSAQELGCGEVYLTSIDRDGTGEGMDIDMICQVSNSIPAPLIASGGVGKYDHFAEGIIGGNAQAVSTANLFNFMEDGLIEARKAMEISGLKMASWDFGFKLVA